MSLVVVGCNHRSTSLDLLERLTVAPEDLPKALCELSGAEHLSESVVLSTCNRIEVYAYAERFHGGYADVREVLARHSGLPPEIVADEIYAFHDIEAVRHLFNVAAGLDSMVVGEHEILGQVRAAFQTARDEGTVGAVLDPLFRRALATGKLARASTGISRGIASIAHASVALAEQRAGGLTGKKILVLGAGELASGTLKSLANASPAEIAVVGRTWDRAVSAAESCNGRAVPLTDLEDALTAVDVMFATTGATNIILEHSDVDEVMRRRDGRPLLILDVAVPRDVAPAARQLPGVTLLDIDDVAVFVKGGRAARAEEIERVQAIVETAIEGHLAEASAREVAPLIAGLRARAHEIAQGELARNQARLNDLSPAQRANVELLLQSTVNKLLHKPTVKLKDAAGHARGDRLAEALRDLFEL